MTRFRHALQFTLTLLACSTGLASAQTPGVAGRWDGVVTVGSANPVEVPFTFEITGTGNAVAGAFFDGPVRVPSTGGTFANGSLDLAFGQYGTRLLATLAGDKLDGKYDRGTRGAAYPFRAVRAVKKPVPAGRVPNIDGEWRIPVKSSKGESAWRFIVRQTGPQVTASILRVDGDTGALTGQFDGTKFVLSHFSGARPLLLEVTPQADGSLQVSQNRQTPLPAFRLAVAAAKAPGAEPANPANFTRMKNPNEPFRFSAKDLNGVLVSNTDARFKGKVVILSVTGSWCPNCHDEAPFLVDLYRTYQSKGLELVALGFEEADQLKNPVRPRAFVKQFGITYPFLLVGEPEDAVKQFTQVENFSAFPTAFVVGRDGKVHAVHAGFASVATGNLHTISKKAFTAEIVKLLAEPAPATR